MLKRLWMYCLPVLLAAAVMVWLGRPTHAYIEAAYTLGKVMAESSNIFLMTVESVDKQKNIIVYRKVRDIKGTHPGETVKHNIGQAGFQPREWQNIMAWAEIGKTAVCFHNGGIAETCIDNYWYQAPLAGDWWNMNHAEPYMLRTFAGKPDKLAAAVTAMLANQEVVIPCMVDGDKNALQLRNAKVQRIKASLKIQEYNAQRDFVDFGSGGDEFRPAAGMPGFTHILALNRMNLGAGAVAPADINNDGRPDLCVIGAAQLYLVQNGGSAFDEVRLPVVGGARAAAWGDYDGDGKPDLLLATPSGAKLFRNTGVTGKVFDDVSAGLPTQDYCNLTAAAWLDYDGDGKPDILLADGFRGLRLYRNLGAKPAPATEPKIGKWQYAGPFDNAGKRGLHAAYPPERELSLAAQYVGKNGEKVAWRELHCNENQAVGLGLFKPELNSNSVVYLCREMDYGGAGELPVSLGCAGALTAWFNGAKVYQESIYHPCAPDQVQLTLKLRPGKNTLLLKVCQGAGDAAFYFSAKPPQTVAPLLFEDVSDAAGLGANGVGSALKGDCLAVADVNGDGRPDFLYSAGSGLLVLNTPKGFVAAKDSGISYQSGGVTPVFGDFDADGKPDLFVPQSGVCKLYRNDGSGHFADVTAATGDLARSVGDARCAAWAALPAPQSPKGRLGLMVGCWRGPNRYFENNGNGTFTDASDDIGLSGRIYNTTGLAVCDLNKDKLPDVVFNNEGQEAVVLLSNQAWFTDRATPKVAAVPTASPASASAFIAAAVAPGSLSGLIGIAVLALGLFCAFLLARSRRRGGNTVPLLALAVLVAASSDAGDWPTARGNAQRTGNVDDKPGPKAPKVLWVHKAKEHYVASPVPAGKALYLATIGGLNTGVFQALALDARVPQRVLWSKSAPYVVRPTVCAPAVADGLVVFGDGMHQTDDAVLYCLQADSGMPVWQLPVPGKLVHLEAGPTLDKGRVYICGGDAGVLCVDAKRITLDGKEQDLAAVVPALAKRWNALVAKYEEEKKKDPVLAIPPSEDALPKAMPKLVWQKGKGAWHIDAPPVVAGDFVLVASAYLDDEKIGKRSLFCLKAADGAVVWESPLTFNPWAGPSVSGQFVLVGCSSIRFDRKLIPQAQGDVRSLDLATGKTHWTKTVTGGVLSPVAVKGDVAVYAGTDGNVVARNCANAQRLWTYNGQQPFFAAPAIAGDTVYVADLKGVVHAIGLADGKALWTLDVTADPAVQTQSLVFGSPVVHGGNLYLATCNVDGEAGQPSCVVCLSDTAAPLAPAADTTPAVPVTVNTAKRSISLPCRIAPRKLATLKDVYPLEVIATYPAPLGQKAHETVVVFDSKPSDVHKALQSIGLVPGKPIVGDGEPTGSEVRILLELPGVTGTPRLVPMEKVIVDTRTGKGMPAMSWRFTGSVMRQPDPDKPDKVYGADSTGTLISLLPVTDEVVCQAGLSMQDGKLLQLDTNKNLLPPEGTPVKLVIEAK